MFSSKSNFSLPGLGACSIYTRLEDSGDASIHISTGDAVTSELLIPKDLLEKVCHDLTRMANMERSRKGLPSRREYVDDEDEDSADN